MKIKSDKGSTEVHFKDFVAVNAAVEQVREGYRAACKEKPSKKDEHAEKVRTWTAKHFGQARYIKDFDVAVKGAVASEAINRWDEWINAQPLGHRKLYYDPTIVAACIMGEDE